MKNNMEVPINYLFTFILLFSMTFIIGCSSDLDGAPRVGQIFVASVSSDGNYAVTSDSYKRIILWDIKNKTHKTISKNANIFSAYFIKNSNMFMWQDLNDFVHIQDIYGKKILAFHNFPTYGHVMSSDLKHYFASDDNWNIYSGYGQNQKLIYKGYLYLSFWGAEKLLNMTLSNDNRLLLTAGDSGRQYSDVPLSSHDGRINLDDVTLWDINGNPQFKLIGNIAKTFATISPDSKYVVSGDEADNLLLWNAITGKSLYQKPELTMLLDMYEYDDYRLSPKPKLTVYTEGFPPIPKQMRKHNVGRSDTYSIKFIDLQEHYLRFLTRNPYVALYSVTNPKPLKYFFLGLYPEPHNDNYSQDEAVDTAPSANILVMGQQNGPGIIVYKYHPDTQTLEKIWAPGADGKHLSKIALINFLVAILLYLIFTKRYISKSWHFYVAILISFAAVLPFATVYAAGISIGMAAFACGLIFSVLPLKKYFKNLFPSFLF